MQSATTIKARNSIPFYSLFIANAISLVSNVFSMIAIPWFVLQTTGSATQIGITGFFTILPVVLAGFLGGTLIDRLGYKRTSIISDLASGVTSAMIALLYLTKGREFWQLIILVFLGALLDAPGTTAGSALLPELAEQAGFEAINGREEATYSSTLIGHAPCVTLRSLSPNRAIQISDTAISAGTS